MTWIPRTSTIAERPWSVIALTSNAKRGMHEQGYTQSDMEEFDRKTNAKEDLRRFFYRTGFTTGINTRSYNPTKEEAATP